MADPVAYFTVQDLVDALGEDVYMACLDDHGTRSRPAVDGATWTRLLITRAHAFVKSWLPNLGALPADNTVPANMSELVRTASLEVAQCYVYRRRPEYTKTYGAFPDGPMWKGAIEMLERIQSGIQRIAPDDHPGENPPPNQGGQSFQDGPKAMVPADPQDNPNQGDW